MSDIIFYAIIAFFTGIFTAMGVGGGSLLLLILISFMGVAQLDAQKINLIYFCMAGLVAVILHIKKDGIDKKTAFAAVCSGIPSAVVCAVFASEISPGILRKAFALVVLAAAVYLLICGGSRGTSEE